MFRLDAYAGVKVLRQYGKKLENGNRKRMIVLIRILYLIPRLNNAGPVNQLLNLVNSLNRERYQPYVVTMYEEEENTRKEDFINAEIEVMCLKLKHKFINVGDKNLFKKIINQINPDIIHTATLPADRLMSGMRENIPWCMTIHCNIYKDYMEGFRKPVNMLYMTRHERYIREADVPICCSRTLTDIYSGHGIVTLCALNGVMTEEYHPVDIQTKRMIREKLGFSRNEKVVLIVGSLDDRKRSLFIINALKNKVKDHRLKLVFCGTGTKEGDCEKAADGCKEILFMKHVKNIATYYQAADYYLSASCSEGLPMSVIEAGCTGLPLLLSDISQHRELTAGTDSLPGVFFFRTDCTGDLQQKFERLIKVNMDNRLIVNHFARHFSARGMGKRYEEIYDEMLVKKKSL